MSLFDIAATLITLAAAFSFINHHWLKLPTTIGLMILTLLFSVMLLFIRPLSPSLHHSATTLIQSIDFDKALMHGMLSFLLFAGALHINLNDLKQQKNIILILATFGVLVSTAFCGTAMYFILQALGLNTPWLYCFIFGALISPTDPIAVMGILKTLGVPKSLETKITGESLFNDGVGVVVFLAIVGLAGLDPSQSHVNANTIAWLFAKEALGGAIFGLATGYFAYALLKMTDNYQVEILISLALVMGGYAAAMAIHISGPLAMVVAGLLIGNHGRALAMSDTTRRHLDTFWKLVDQILNAVLFVLIGLEVLAVSLRYDYWVAGVIAIGVTLVARFVSVSLPITLFRPFRPFTPHAIKVLTWGGLRGGISVALALSLRETLGKQVPESYHLILVMTYAVVIFSIIVQGLTISPMLRALKLTTPTNAPPPSTSTPAK